MPRAACIKMCRLVSAVDVARQRPWRPLGGAQCRQSCEKPQPGREFRDIVVWRGDGLRRPFFMALLIA